MEPVRGTGYQTIYFKRVTLKPREDKTLGQNPSINEFPPRGRKTPSGLLTNKHGKRELISLARLQRDLLDQPNITSLKHVTPRTKG